MKKTIAVSVAIILAIVVLSLYQGIHQTFTGFDLILAVCIFFLGMLANSGKEIQEHKPTRLNYMMRDPQMQNEISKVFDEAKNERCENGAQ